MRGAVATGPNRDGVRGPLRWRNCARATYERSERAWHRTNSALSMARASSQSSTRHFHNDTAVYFALFQLGEYIVDRMSGNS